MSEAESATNQAADLSDPVSTQHDDSELKDTRAMIDVIASPSCLLPEYADATLPGFIPGIKYLAGKYAMRRVRGDGNCFYRAFLFSYLEQLLSWHSSDDQDLRTKSLQEYERIKALLTESRVIMRNNYLRSCFTWIYLQVKTFFWVLVSQKLLLNAFMTQSLS